MSLLRRLQEDPEKDQPESEIPDWLKDDDELDEPDFIGPPPPSRERIFVPPPAVKQEEAWYRRLWDIRVKYLTLTVSLVSMVGVWLPDAKGLVAAMIFLLAVHNLLSTMPRRNRRKGWWRHWLAENGPELGAVLSVIWVLLGYGSAILTVPALILFFDHLDD
jgi:hypothetical protein